jgi:hypothetical protein
LRSRKSQRANFPKADCSPFSARKPTEQPGNPRTKTVANRTALLNLKGAEDEHSGQTSAVVYLVFDAAQIFGFENRDSSSLGFTSTLVMLIFSGGTGGSLNPSAVLATWRTFVSRTYGI